MPQQSSDISKQLPITFPIYFILDRTSVTLDANGCLEAFGPNANFYYLNFEIGSDTPRRKCIPLFFDHRHAAHMGKIYGLPNVAVMSIPTTTDLWHLLTHQSTIVTPHVDFVAFYSGERGFTVLADGLAPIKEVLHTLSTARDILQTTRTSEADKGTT